MSGGAALAYSHYNSGFLNFKADDRRRSRKTFTWPAINQQIKNTDVGVTKDYRVVIRGLRRKYADVLIDINDILNVELLVPDCSEMIRKSLRALQPPEVGSTDEQLFEETIDKLRDVELLRSSVVYDKGMFYFALYLRHNLKVTFSLYCDNDPNLYVSFKTEDGDLIKEDTMTIDCLAESIKEILRRCDNEL